MWKSKVRNNNIMKTYSGWRKKNQIGKLDHYFQMISQYIKETPKPLQITSTADKQLHQSGWV